MAKPPLARKASPLTINGSEIEFSPWPTRKTTRHLVQFRLFSSDPWPLIRNQIESRCPLAARAQALSFAAQAQDLYRASNISEVTAAKPLLVYYSMMNLVKAFILTRSVHGVMTKAAHGLSDRTGTATTADFARANLEVKDGNVPNVFPLFARAIGFGPISNGSILAVPDMLPQVVPGHRLWAAAANKGERFVAIDDIEFRHDAPEDEVWLRLYLKKDHLSRLYVTSGALLARAGLGAGWRVVTGPDNAMIYIEQAAATKYSTRPSDVLSQVVGSLKDYVWAVVTSHPPYRRYYVYLPPDGNRAAVVPQLLSIYALFYYFSSITRYRPEIFSELLRGKYGPMLHGFFADQPIQFLFLMAAHFVEQDVAKAAIIRGD